MILSGRPGRVAVLAAALSLSGCASAFSGYDLAPNGLPQGEADLRHSLATEPAEAHEAVIDGERPLPDDDLLRLLYAATTGRYAGEYETSSRFLDVASYVAEDRVTQSVSRQALSFITSDRALPFTPGRTERLMIPYVAAVDFLQLGDRGGAAVEARRIEALLDRYDEGVPRDEIPESSRFLHYFAATIFDAAGDRNAADVAYRRAGVDGPEIKTPYTGESVPTDSLGDVVVLVERGFVPHRVEQSVVVALPPFHVAKLTEGSVGEKAAAAAAAAGQIVLHAAALYGDRGPYYTDQGYRQTMNLSPWRDECDGWNTPSWCDDDFDPYFLRISWPVLYHDPVPDRPIKVRADDAVVGTTRRLDVSAGVRQDFSDARATILTRTVFRAAAKLTLTEAAEDAVAKKDKTAGEIVGFLFNLGTLLTERADTRSWHLLPGSVDMVRLRLPAGTHELAIDEDGWPGRGIALGTVDVRPGETTFVAHRIWR